MSAGTIEFPMYKYYIKYFNGRDRFNRVYHFDDEWINVVAKLDPHRIGYFYVTLTRKVPRTGEIKVVKYWDKDQLARYVSWLESRNPYREKSLNTHPGWWPYIQK